MHPGIVADFFSVIVSFAQKWMFWLSGNDAVGHIPLKLIYRIFYCHIEKILGKPLVQIWNRIIPLYKLKINYLSDTLYFEIRF